MEINATTKRWKEVRKFLGLSQPEFAEKLGTTQAAISLIESGKTKNPSIDLINRFFQCFPQVNKEWFFSGKGNMLHNPNGFNAEKILEDKNLLELPDNYRFDPAMKEYSMKVKTLVASMQKQIDTLERDKFYLQGLLQKQFVEG